MLLLAEHQDIIAKIEEMESIDPHLTEEPDGVEYSDALLRCYKQMGLLASDRHSGHTFHNANFSAERGCRPNVDRNAKIFSLQWRRHLYHTLAWCLFPQVQRRAEK